MTRLRIDKPLRAALLDQLVAAGVAPLTPEGTSILQIDAGDGGGWLTVPDAQLPVAQATVAAFDAAAIDTQAQQAATKLAQARQVLRDYYLNSAPTNAQSVAAIKALILAVRALAQIDN